MKECRLNSQWQCRFIVALHTCKKDLLASLWLFACISWAHTEQIFVKFDIEDFIKICQNPNLVKIRYKNIRHFT